MTEDELWKLIGLKEEENDSTQYESSKKKEDFFFNPKPKDLETGRIQVFGRNWIEESK